MRSHYFYAALRYVVCAYFDNEDIFVAVDKVKLVARLYLVAEHIGLVAALFAQLFSRGARAALGLGIEEKVL